jgi:hypothetical protein
VQILKNNIKNSFYKGIGTLVPYKTPLRVVFYQINPYKTRSLIYYFCTHFSGKNRDYDSGVIKNIIFECVSETIYRMF